MNPRKEERIQGMIATEATRDASGAPARWLECIQT